MAGLGECACVSALLLATLCACSSPTPRVVSVAVPVTPTATAAAASPARVPQGVCRSYPPRTSRRPADQWVPLAAREPIAVDSCDDLQMVDVTDERPVVSDGAGLSTFRVHRGVQAVTFFLVVGKDRTLGAPRVCENMPFSRGAADSEPPFEDWVHWHWPQAAANPPAWNDPDVPACASAVPVSPLPEPTLVTVGPLPIIPGSDCGPYASVIEARYREGAVVVTSGDSLRSLGTMVPALVLFTLEDGGKTLVAGVCGTEAPNTRPTAGVRTHEHRTPIGHLLAVTGATSVRVVGDRK